MGALAEKGTNLFLTPDYLPGYSTVHGDQLMPGFQEVLLGQLSPKDFLYKWAEAMEEEKKLYEKNKK